MLTVTVLLILGAFLTTIANAIGKCPLWVPVLLLTLDRLLSVIPR